MIVLDRARAQLQMIVLDKTVTTDNAITTNRGHECVSYDGESFCET